MKYGIDVALEPNSVAVIGASSTKGKWGHSILKGIIDSNYGGKVYPVNLKGGEILGLRAYTNIMEIVGTIDLAIIGIKAGLVPAAIEDCQRKGVKAALIISGGFAEAGPDGKQLQAEVLKIAGDIRIIGPNTFGIVNLSKNFNASYLRPLKGNLALICQGGNVTGEVEYIARKRGLGFTQIIDPGNQADASICDFLEYVQRDSATRAILMYMEGFRENEGRRFFQLAKQITMNKPIVAIKAGTTEAGTRAASSHTGSLTGQDAIYNTAFRQAGIVRAKDSFELVDFSEALIKMPLMKGKRVAVLVDGGSHATMACDAISRSGLELASLSDKTKSRLREILLPHSPVANPVDFAGAIDTDIHLLSETASLILQDGNVDGLAVAGMNFGGYAGWFGTQEKLPADFTGLTRRYEKPIVWHNCMVGEETPALKTLREGGIPVFFDVERAVRTLAALATYRTYQKSALTT